jgi:hypothetical protein
VNNKASLAVDQVKIGTTVAYSTKQSPLVITIQNLAAALSLGVSVESVIFKNELFLTGEFIT